MRKHEGSTNWPHPHESFLKIFVTHISNVKIRRMDSFKICLVTKCQVLNLRTWKLRNTSKTVENYVDRSELETTGYPFFGETAILLTNAIFQTDQESFYSRVDVWNLAFFHESRFGINSSILGSLKHIHVKLLTRRQQGHVSQRTMHWFVIEHLKIMIKHSFYC